MSFIIHPSDVEPGASSFTAQPREEAGLCLLVPGVHRVHLDSSTHDAIQPSLAVDAESLQIRVHRSVPTEVLLFFSGARYLRGRQEFKQRGVGVRKVELSTRQQLAYFLH